MVMVAPETIRAWKDSRRACLRIRCRRGCMPEGYAQRCSPARVYGGVTDCQVIVTAFCLRFRWLGMVRLHEIASPHGDEADRNAQR